MVVLNTYELSFLEQWVQNRFDKSKDAFKQCVVNVDGSVTFKFMPGCGSVANRFSSRLKDEYSIGDVISGAPIQASCFPDGQTHSIHLSHDQVSRLLPQIQQPALAHNIVRANAVSAVAVKSSMQRLQELLACPAVFESFMKLGINDNPHFMEGAGDVGIWFYDIASAKKFVSWLAMFNIEVNLNTSALTGNSYYVILMDNVIEFLIDECWQAMQSMRKSLVQVLNRIFTSESYKLLFLGAGITESIYMKPSRDEDGVVISFVNQENADWFFELLQLNGIACKRGWPCHEHKCKIYLPEKQADALIGLLEAETREERFKFPPSLAQVLDILHTRQHRNKGKMEAISKGEGIVDKSMVLKYLQVFVVTMIRQCQGQAPNVEQLMALEQQFSNVVNGVDEKGIAGHDVLCQARTAGGWFKGLLPGSWGDVGSMTDVRECLEIIKQLLVQVSVQQARSPAYIRP